jgi:hypothetical protein
VLLTRGQKQREVLAKLEVERIEEGLARALANQW